MQILSQRDPKWGNIKLGTSNTYIKDYGCTITCLAMIIGTTPDVVNDRMKAVGGFANGNLVIWSKIEEAFPGIKQRRVWSYDNTDVLASVPNVLVEVPGSYIGGTGKHWVVYVGDKKMYDPWTGTERPTSDMPGQSGYCVLTGKWADAQNQDSDLQDQLDKMRQERDANWNLYSPFKDAGYENVDKVKAELKSKQDTIDNLNQQINDRNNNIVQLNARISTLEAQVTGLTQKADSLETQAKRVPELEKLASEYESHRVRWSEQEKTYNRTVGQLKSENEALRNNAFHAWLVSILNKFGLK